MSGLTSARRSPRLLFAPPERPRTRAECVDGQRPCPFIGCRHHLDSDEHEPGQHPRFAERLSEHRPSCSLDLADSGRIMDVEEIAAATGLWHTNVEQALASGMAKMAADPVLAEFFADQENRERMHPLADAQRWADPAPDVDE